ALLRHTGCVVVASIGAVAIVVAIAIASCTNCGTPPALAQRAYVMNAGEKYHWVEEVAPLAHDANVQDGAEALLQSANDIALMTQRVQGNDDQLQHFFAYRDADGVAVFPILPQAPAAVTRPVCYRDQTGIHLAIHGRQPARVVSVDPTLGCTVETDALDRMTPLVDRVLSLPKYVPCQADAPVAPDAPPPVVQLVELEAGRGAADAVAAAATHVDSAETFSVIRYAAGSAEAAAGFFGYWVGYAEEEREDLDPQMAVPMYRTRAAAQAAEAEHRGSCMYLHEEKWCVYDGADAPPAVVMDQDATGYYLVHAERTDTIMARANLRDQEELARREFRQKGQVSELTHAGDFMILEIPGAAAQPVSKQVLVRKDDGRIHAYMVDLGIADHPELAYDDDDAICLYNEQEDFLYRLAEADGTLSTLSGCYAVKRLVELVDGDNPSHSLYPLHFEAPPTRAALGDAPFGLSMDGTTLYVPVGDQVRALPEGRFEYDPARGTVSHTTAAGEVFTLPGDPAAFIQAYELPTLTDRAQAQGLQVGQAALFEGQLLIRLDIKEHANSTVLLPINDSGQPGTVARQADGSYVCHTEHKGALPVQIGGEDNRGIWRELNWPQLAEEPGRAWLADQAVGRGVRLPDGRHILVKVSAQQIVRLPDSPVPRVANGCFAMRHFNGRMSVYLQGSTAGADDARAYSLPSQAAAAIAMLMEQGIIPRPLAEPRAAPAAAAPALKAWQIAGNPDNTALSIMTDTGPLELPVATTPGLAYVNGAWHYTLQHGDGSILLLQEGGEGNIRAALADIRHG
ncbi:MAG: hypothetical protein ACKVOH_02370, partial [Chlamydiales bacterium]